MVLSTATKSADGRTEQANAWPWLGLDESFRVRVQAVSEISDMFFVGGQPDTPSGWSVIYTTLNAILRCEIVPNSVLIHAFS